MVRSHVICIEQRAAIVHGRAGKARQAPEVVGAMDVLCAQPSRLEQVAIVGDVCGGIANDAVQFLGLPGAQFLLAHPLGALKAAAHPQYRNRIEKVA
jgi:hypothetical protein